MRDESPREAARAGGLSQYPHQPAPGAGLGVERLAAGYDRRLVVDDVSFTVPPGSLTALIGPNGSGKSTLLATMARLMKPRGGTVTLDGRAIHAMPTKALARTLGILPQAPLVPEGLTVFELVSRGRYPHQGLMRQWSAADEAMVEQALVLTGTRDLAGRPVETLSGGQRQRCWIAMAVAQETQVILLDEPTTFLDLRYQVEVLDLLARLARGHGRTVVAVLHDLNMALAFADQVLCLKDGRIRAVADAAAPLTPQVVEEVFGIEVAAVTNPRTGTPVFIPLAGAAP